jgi:hypothetical protein
MKNFTITEIQEINSVQDLLDKLLQVEDKTVPIVIWDDGDLRDISMIDDSIMGDDEKLLEVHINMEHREAVTVSKEKPIEAIPRKGRPLANMSQSRLITLLDEAYKVGHSDCGQGRGDFNPYLEKVITKVFGEAVDLDEWDRAHSELRQDQGEKSLDEVG